MSRAYPGTVSSRLRHCDSGPTRAQFQCPPGLLPVIELQYLPGPPGSISILSFRLLVAHLIFLTTCQPAVSSFRLLVNHLVFSTTCRTSSSFFYLLSTPSSFFSFPQLHPSVTPIFFLHRHRPFMSLCHYHSITSSANIPIVCPSSRHPSSFNFVITTFHHHHHHSCSVTLSPHFPLSPSVNLSHPFPSLPHAAGIAHSPLTFPRYPQLHQRNSFPPASPNSLPSTSPPLRL
jgi:hypothetical protein